MSEALAPGLVLGDRVRIGEGVSFGAHVVVHDDVEIGDGCTIQDHVILGKPSIRPGSDGPEPAAPLVLGPDVTVGAGAIVFAGARIEAGVVVGDHAYVRERAQVGRDAVLGRTVAIGADVVVGERVRMQNNAALVSGCVVEDDVFVGPNVVTTDDDTMGRRPDGTPRRPCTLRRGCRIGAAVVLLPGVEVGEEAIVGAGSVVRESVASRTLVVGAPARLVRALG
jgi:UDP-2-acetamido-3-amino-2,3-dideoxy-glucuronate N-acetyltransferase